MVKFVIITTQRSGSTLLIKSLDQNEKILLSGEIFHDGPGIHHPENQYRVTYFPFIRKKYQYWLNAPILALRYKSHVRSYFLKAEKSGYTAAGFKLMISQMKYMPGILQLFKSEDVKFIILIRKNSANIVFSAFIAKFTGRYHSTEKLTETNSLLFINPKSFIKRLHKVDRIKTKLEKLSTSKSVLTIYYEEFKDWDQVIEKICDYLDIDLQKVKQKLKKINKGDQYKKLIGNYSVLQKLIQ